VNYKTSVFPVFLLIGLCENVYSQELIPLADRLFHHEYKVAAKAREELENLAKSDDKRGIDAKRTLADFDLRAAMWLAEYAEQPIDSDLVTVRISNGVKPEEFCYLRTIKPLKKLSFHGHPISDEHVRYLSGLPDLISLGFTNTSINGNGLSKLNLPKLEVFAILIAPMGDLQFDGTNFNSKWLAFSRVPLTDELLNKIVAPELIILSLDRTEISSASLANLDRFPKLNQLWAEVEHFDKAAIEKLRSHPKLRKLRVFGKKSEQDTVDRLKKQLPSEWTIDFWLNGSLRHPE